MAKKKTGKKVAKKAGKKVVKKKSRVAAKKKSATPKKLKQSSAIMGNKSVGKKIVAKKSVAKAATQKVPAKKFVERKIRGKSDGTEVAEYELKGMGARSGGQSGDTQGLSGRAESDSESVEELLEEGQAFEAEVLAGVENVPDADQGEVRTHEVPEDDIPDEYLGKDNQR